MGEGRWRRSLSDLDDALASIGSPAGRSPSASGSEDDAASPALEAELRAQLAEAADEMAAARPAGPAARGAARPDALCGAGHAQAARGPSAV